MFVNMCVFTLTYTPFFLSAHHVLKRNYGRAEERGMIADGYSKRKWNNAKLWIKSQ